jgi:hypothetical protein
MTNSTQQPLPASTRQRLEEWIRQQQRLADLIEATLAATRDALDVPPHWTIKDIGEGFIDPAAVAAEQPEGAAFPAG